MSITIIMCSRCLKDKKRVEMTQVKKAHWECPECGLYW